MRQTQRVRFPSRNGHDLVGIMERPLEETRFQAVFCHCFTCSKDLKTIVKMSRELVRLGIAVFRFDFTGIGESQGDFSRSTFASNVEDLLDAVAYVSDQGQPPQLVIGHSLGGATALAAASQLPAVKAICTLAAPSETPHLADILIRLNPDIAKQGEGQVVIGGQKFWIRQELIEGLRNYRLPDQLAQVTCPVLLVHSPADETVDIEHAFRLQQQLRPKASLHLLPDSDHLFSQNPDDVRYLAQLISMWSEKLGVGV